MEHLFVWIISLITLACILIRPFEIAEWIWASSGAIILLIFGKITLPHAWQAVTEGVDVYFFLLGMMLLSEQARQEGLFDFIAEKAASLARGSPRRLFALIYACGILVTAFLSNDATAVVMTPAVFAAVKKAGAKPLPYLFSCALIANAASFLLPISNPANLVVYQSKLPSMLKWISMFGLPSLLSIAATYAVMLWYFRKDLSERLSEAQVGSCHLSKRGKLTAAGLCLAIVVMLGASALSIPLGLPVFISAGIIVILLAIQAKAAPRKVLKDVAWGVVPMVAGLFVLVEAMNEAGARKFTQHWLENLSHEPALIGNLKAAFGVGLASNILNNLPAGLISASALAVASVSESIRKAVLIGIDLGPNLSITGSLATLLWLMALRRERIKVNFGQFLRLGCIAMPIALALAILALF